MQVYYVSLRGDANVSEVVLFHHEQPLAIYVIFQKHVTVLTDAMLMLLLF